jgi:nitroreductase
MDLSVTDHLLCSTRSVRKRLDFSRPVEPAVIERCIEIALQSPTGSNAQGWHFLVVTDTAKRAEISRHYRECFEMYLANPEMRATYGDQDLRAEQMPRVISSATWLAQHMHEAPVLLIPCIEGRVENAGPVAQASVYGSILPATWSFMLAARARGLGSAWTTLHILREREVATLLGIPDTVTQAALLPVAHFTGTDFKPAKRLPARELTSWNAWGAKRP